MKKLLKVSCVAMMAVGLASCSATNSNSDSIVIGTIGPYEGAASAYGIAVKNGVQLAIDEFNESSTLLDKKITLVAYDGKADAIEATNAYNKLVDNDQAIAVVGATTSGESIAIANAAVGYSTPILSPSATAPEFTSIGDNVFRGCFTDPMQAKSMAEFAYKEMGLKKVAIVYNTGSDYSDGLTKNFTETFTSLGGEVLATEGYADGDTDFNAQLTKIANLDVEAIYLPNYYQEDAQIAKQARDLGISVPFLGGDGWDGILSVIDDASIVEGSVFCNHYSPENEAVQEFLAKYQEKFSVEANAFSILAYDCTNLMIQAIQEAGTTDAAAINEALANIDFTGLLGHVSFDENGDPIKDLAHIVIRDGQYQGY